MLTAVRSVGHIKARPEDFVVQEDMNGRFVAPQFTTSIRPSESTFTAFTLTKRNVQAIDSYREVARQLGVRRSHITDCGRKDKVALTTQTLPFYKTIITDEGSMRYDAECKKSL